MNDILTACQSVIALFVRVFIGVSIVIPAGIVVWMIQIRSSKEAGRADSLSASACTLDSENYPGSFRKETIYGDKPL